MCQNIWGYIVQKNYKKLLETYSMIHIGSFYLFNQEQKISKLKEYSILDEHKEKFLKYIENHQYGLAFLLDALLSWMAYLYNRVTNPWIEE